MLILDLIIERDVSSFVTIIRNLKNVLNNANIEINSNIIHGLPVNEFKIKGYNRMHSALCIVNINREPFSHFYCKNNKMILGIDMARLYNILRDVYLYNTNAILRLYIDDNDAEYLCIAINDKYNNRTALEFKLQLIDNDERPMNIPEIEYDVAMKINYQSFYNTCRFCKLLTDNVKLQYQHDGTLKFIPIDLDNIHKSYATSHKSIKPLDIATNSRCVSSIEQIYNIDTLLTLYKLFGERDIDLYMKNDTILAIRSVEQETNLPILGEILLALAPVEDEKHTIVKQFVEKTGLTVNELKQLLDDM